MSVVPAMLAERLGAAAADVRAQGRRSTDGTVKIERLTDDGYDVVEAPLPAVVSVVEKINEPRYPSFKGIMAAKKKPLDHAVARRRRHRRRTRSASPARGPRSRSSRRAAEQAGQIVKDEGDGGASSPSSSRRRSSSEPRHV